MEWTLFASIFSVIFIAELPDKTAFATLLMATRGRPLAIFMGVAGAFVVQSAIAVAFGSLIGLLPEHWVHLGAGILFLAFAAHTWVHTDDTEEVEENTSSANTVWKAFVVIFIAEWGDLTQIATASLSAHYHESPWTVFTAATLALWSVTAVAVFLGHRVKHLIHGDTLKKISVLVFTGVGIYFIFTWLLASHIKT
jgi:putative Ca2+/H+ antiporter (TMEM165/GDT1 family)